ncbi:YkvA family protein [Rhizobium sp. BR 362]|uniref:YkvA family protein n=1 Tax=Rhizobium sp. BR 362 TaxID=3040670 RepID=UPI002F419FCE
MDDIKYGEILMPGDEETQERQEKSVRSKFWPTLRKAARYIPFSRDVVAAFYCALDPQTPTRVRGILLAALGYFVMPVDIIPDFFAVIGFSDDVAVLTLAFGMIQSHIRQEHYDAADRALANEPEAVKTA